MRPHRLLTFIVFPLLALPLGAQTERILPEVYAPVWGGNNGTGTGLGTPKGIFQGLYIQPFAANSLVFSVGFRRNPGTTDYAAFTIDTEILVSSTTANLQTSNATFANNLGMDATVVFPRQVVNVPARGANSGPLEFIEFPVTAPWIFQGPNLLVQMKSFAPTWTSTPFRMDRCFERTTAGEAITFGLGCSAATAGSTAAGSYRTGTSFSFTLSSAPASQPALALLGFDLTRLLGVPLPLDLSGLGMTGCVLLVPPAVVLPAVTDASGAASHGLAIPADPNLEGRGFGMQWVHADPSMPNPAGLVATAGRHFLIGPIVCPNRYVWELFDEAATSGSLQAGGPIARVTTAP